MLPGTEIFKFFVSDHLNLPMTEYLHVLLCEISGFTYGR